MPSPHGPRHHDRLDEFGPPDHFLFDVPSPERFAAAMGDRSGRMASKLLQRRGAPPEHSIEIELLLALFDRLYKLEGQLAGLTRESTNGQSTNTG